MIRYHIDNQNKHLYTSLQDSIYCIYIMYGFLFYFSGVKCLLAKHFEIYIFLCNIQVQRYSLTIFISMYVPISDNPHKYIILYMSYKLDTRKIYVICVYVSKHIYTSICMCISTIHHSRSNRISEVTHDIIISDMKFPSEFASKAIQFSYETSYYLCMYYVCMYDAC